MNVTPLKQIPIPKAPDKNLVCKITQLSDGIIQEKKRNPQSDISELENEIDYLVYELFELTPEEIAVVEEETSS
jgi:hypothetical protein